MVLFLPPEDRCTSLLHVRCSLAQRFLCIDERIAAFFLGLALTPCVTCCLDPANNVLVARSVTVPCLLICTAGLLCLLDLLHAHMQILHSTMQLRGILLMQRLLCDGETVGDFLMIHSGV